MSDERRVLGIDLASRSWQDNGSALLAFSVGSTPTWSSVEYGVLKWPTATLSPSRLAETIEQAVLDRRIVAVGLDGPQGWREPGAGARKGVGRVCEYEARCQGKTGEYGKTYPQTQHGWIQFCIDVFAELVAKGNAVLANDPDHRKLDPLPDGKYRLLECFPTSTWRSSGLAALPGKSRIGRNQQQIAAFARSLHLRYGLSGLGSRIGSHDDLQAVVAGLPAAGLLGGPCIAVPNGKPGWCEQATECRPAHWVEGLIWDATLPDELLARPVDLPIRLPDERPSVRDAEASNPLLIDDRDDGGERLLRFGVRLFRHLAELANAGQAIGVGYAQLVCIVHGVDQFQAVANRKYSQSDTAHVLRFAHQITEENGGPIRITRGPVTINAGMDAFVWRNKSPYDRPAQAFNKAAGYSREAWKDVFPDGRRRLLSNRECVEMAAPQHTDDRENEDR